MTLLQIENLTKSFGVNTALDGITLTIEPGEVHALVGENGAGKSTLIKVLTGVYEPTDGRLIWNGQEVQVNSPKEAQQLGINVIHQDRQLIPYFTGIENLYLSIPYPNKAFGLGIDWNKMMNEAKELLERWGMNFPLKVPASNMTPSERTMLEIARAMMHDSKLLILDEPTASLTDKESELLFTFIERLRDEGVAIIYISHRLEEVIRLSNRVSVLMGGKWMKTLEREDLSIEKLVHYMTDGQAKAASDITHHASTGETVLKIENLSTVDQTVKSANFELKAGEILGVYGLAGAGRTETMEAIYGLRKMKDGTIFFQQQKVENPTPGNSIQSGMVLIPENRHDDALIMQNTITENMTLPIINQFTRNGVLQKKDEQKRVNQEMKRFQVKAVDSKQTIAELSGGNQQKVVFAKALLSNPDIYICDEPTQAVDIMTRNDIHNFLREQAIEGKGVLYVSSDLHEILEISDRIIVFSEGKTVADLPNINLQPNDILDICYSFQKEVAQL
ncbi:sugar ABC transporter ATP-binding protein [Bacillus sp. FSL K6-3431]|uniref:sugar ABC transporter ATP-binding protein n=1 Tax=Bacillus sp. FSL K6-3431 TaxID=2921500 RepID=UPI0030FD1C2B